NNIAAALRARGDTARALEASEESLAIRERVLGERSLEVAESLNNIANLYRTLDQPDEALRTLQRSVAIRRELLEEDHPLLLESLINLGVLEMTASKHFEAARALIEKGLAGLERRLGPDHPELAYALTHLGNIERFEERWDLAAQRFERATRIRQKTLPPGHRLTAYSAAMLGMAMLRLGEVDRAESLIRDNLAPVAGWFGEEHERTRELRGALAECQRLREGAPAATSAAMGR
ncbi:MAG: tetratricopeptide repeat protein, partial [Planctomycetes bacterium]|nr:tetratricopeptide repeat protein [Planctomycetota bacterium]